MIQKLQCLHFVTNDMEYTLPKVLYSENREKSFLTFKVVQYKLKKHIVPTIFTNFTETKKFEIKYILLSHYRR